MNDQRYNPNLPQPGQAQNQAPHPAGEQPNQPQTGPARDSQTGFGALSLSEEMDGQLFRAAYAAYAGKTAKIPPARPERDERGRKMSQAYRLRTGRVRIWIPAFFMLIFAALMAVIFIITLDKLKNAGEYALMIGAIVVPLAIGIILLLSNRSTNRAIAWDNRHGATIRRLAAQAGGQNPALGSNAAGQNTAQNGEYHPNSREQNPDANPGFQHSPAIENPQYYALNNHQNRPQNQHQYIPGTGALSKDEEKLEHVLKIEKMRETRLAPPARPARDEHGRKLDPTYQPRSQKGRYPFYGTIGSILFVGFIASAGTNLPETWKMIAFAIGVGLGILLIIAAFKMDATVKNAIEYDERHGAAARFMPPPPDDAHKLEPLEWSDYTG
ncbi:MAG: hypothetical protein Q4C71_04125 [Microbacteriaceae bacterium]|nr:hypothetical protein [Microbacteriaceae bacterium]